MFLFFYLGWHTSWIWCRRWYRLSLNCGFTFDAVTVILGREQTTGQTHPKQTISRRSLVLVYTCQLFLRYRREIFILGVLGFLKTTRSFPKIPEEFRSFPKKSEVFRRCPKSSKFAYCDESENSPRISQSQS